MGFSYEKPYSLKRGRRFEFATDLLKQHKHADNQRVLFLGVAYWVAKYLKDSLKVEIILNDLAILKLSILYCFIYAEKPEALTTLRQNEVIWVTFRIPMHMVDQPKSA